MKKSHSLTANFIFNLCSQILSVVVPCITVPYLARTLGPASLGEYSFALSLVTYFASFTNLGINLYGQRQIAYLRNSSRKLYSTVFWELVLLRVCTGIISLVLYFIFIVHISNNILLSSVLSLEVLSAILDITWMYQGFENFQIIVIRNLFVRILSVIAIFTLIRTPDDVVLYAGIMSGSNLLGFASMWLGVKDYIEFVPIRTLHVLRHLRGTISLYLPQVTTQIYTVLDKTMLGFMTNSNLENGYYDQAHKVILILFSVVTALGPVMVPRIANLYKEGDFGKIKFYIEKSFSFIWFISFPVMFGVISVASVFVPFFFGPGYEKVIILLQLFSFILIPLGIGSNIGLQYLVPTGQEKYLTHSYVLGAVVNFILNLFIIPYWQSVGTTLASVAAEIAVSSYQLWVVRDQLPVFHYFKLMKNYLISGLIMFAVLYLIPSLSFHLFWQLVLKIVIGSAVYFSVLYVLKDDFYREILNMAKMKLGSKLKRR